MLHASLEDIAPQSVAADLREDLGVADADELWTRLNDDSDTFTEMSKSVGKSSANSVVKSLRKIARQNREDKPEDNPLEKYDDGSIEFHFCVDAQTVNKLNAHGLEDARDVVEYAAEHGVEALLEIDGIGPTRFDSLEPGVRSLLDKQTDETNDDEDADDEDVDSDDSESIEVLSEHGVSDNVLDILTEQAGLETVEELREQAEWHTLTLYDGIGPKGEYDVLFALAERLDVDVAPKRRFEIAQDLNLEDDDGDTDDSDEDAQTSLVDVDADDDTETDDGDDEVDEGSSDDDDACEDTDDEDDADDVDSAPSDDIERADVDDIEPGDTVVGPFIRKVRKQRTDMSCADIAAEDVADCHSGHWARIERGETLTSKDKIERVADALPISEDEREWLLEAFDAEKSHKSSGGRRSLSDTEKKIRREVADMTELEKRQLLSHIRGE